MEKFEYSTGTMSLRVMPEDYMVASYEKGHWVVDLDGAIPEAMGMEIFKFLNHIDNKFKIDSWKGMEFKKSWKNADRNRVDFGRTVHFLGRNGTFQSVGVTFFMATMGQPDVILEPVTSKGASGRCQIVIPYEHLKEVGEKLVDLSKPH